MNNILSNVDRTKLLMANAFDNGFSIIKEYEPEIILKLNIINSKKYYFVLRLWNQDLNNLRVTITHGYSEGKLVANSLEILWDDSFITSFYKVIDIDTTGEYFINSARTSIIDKKGKSIDTNKFIEYLYRLHTSLLRRGNYFLKFKYISRIIKLKLYHIIVSILIKTLNFVIKDKIDFSFFVYSKETDLMKTYEELNKKEIEEKKDNNLFGVILPRIATIIFSFITAIVFIILYLLQIKSYFLVLIAKYNILTIVFSISAITIIVAFIFTIKIFLIKVLKYLSKYYWKIFRFSFIKRINYKEKNR